MSNQVPKRSCLVTGAGRGIGRELALAFAQVGARVAVLDRDQQSAAAVVREIGDSGGQASELHLDLEEHLAVRERLDLFLASFGSIDILVNNAALVIARPFLETTADELARAMAVNVFAAFACSQAVAPGMMAKRWGRIINIVSHSGIRGSSNRAGYAATKGALIAATRVAAVELAPHGITVNAIAPGPIETEHTRSAHSPARRRAWKEAVPLGRYGRGEEVAATAVFLASEKASYITAQTLAVDGGFTEAGLIERN
jgi:NAD(P)-dependent dehydrogenase (short-subunit alcohol dehydrogenase family)